MIRAKEPLQIIEASFKSGQIKEYKLIKNNITFINILQKELNEAICDGYTIERIDIINEIYVVWLYRFIDKAPQDPEDSIEENPEILIEYVKAMNTYCKNRNCDNCVFNQERGCRLFSQLDK